MDWSFTLHVDGLRGFLYLVGLALIVGGAYELGQISAGKNSIRIWRDRYGRYLPKPR